MRLGAAKLDSTQFDVFVGIRFSAALRMSFEVCGKVMRQRYDAASAWDVSSALFCLSEKIKPVRFFAITFCGVEIKLCYRRAATIICLHLSIYD